MSEYEKLDSKWIDEHKKGMFMDNKGRKKHFVWVDDLQNLLVPKQEDMFNGEEPDEGEVYFAIGLEGAVEVNSAKSIDEAIERLTEHETNYNISRKPVIPKFVAEYIDFAKRNTLLIRVMELANTRNELPKWKKEYDWISENHETFARAWLDGFTVEEQKYYVLDEGNIPFLAISNGEVNREPMHMTIYAKGRDNAQFALTEKEIKDYDPRYWAFRKPVEELEE